MSTWSEISLKELYLEPSLNGLNRPRRVRGIGYKMVNMGELYKYDRIRNPTMELVPMNEREIEKYSLKPGDLIFARQSLVKEGAGKVSIIIETPEIVTFEGHLIRVRLNQMIANPYYYYYYFTSSVGKGNMQTIVMQVAAAGIRGSELAELKVPYPPLDIQSSIDGILSTYDDLIENNRRRIQLLEDMARALYREWFVHFRFPGHEDVELVDSELGEIPEGWRVAPFTEMVEILSGGTPRTHKPEYWSGSIPFFTPRDIKGEFYILDTERHITQLGLDNCKSENYPKNTVFITARGTVGRVVMPAVPMAMSQTSYALRGKNNINQFFVFYKTHECVDQLKKMTHGAVFDTIITDTFRMLKICLPPEEIIEFFYTDVSPLLDLILILTKENSILQSTRDILIPRLVSGKIDVSDLKIEILPDTHKTPKYSD